MGDEQLLKKDGEWYGCEEVWRGTMGADTMLMREGLVMAKGGGGGVGAERGEKQNGKVENSLTER